MSVAFGSGIGMPFNIAECGRPENGAVVIQSIVGQVANQLEFWDPTGVVLSSVDVNGNFSGGVTPASAVILSPATSLRNVIQPTADVVPLTIKGFVGQTANLQNWTDSTGTILAKINAAGRLTVGMANFRDTVGGDDLSGGTPFTWRPITITPSADADVTLSATQMSAYIQSLAAGAWASGHNIIAPTVSGGSSHFSNSSGFSAVVKTLAGVGITVPTGFAAFLRCNGTDIKQMSPFVNPITGAINTPAASASSIGGVVFTGTADHSAQNIITDAVTGTKIGTATTQKLGFFNAAPVVQQVGASAAGMAAIVDVNAQAALQALQLALGNLGFVTSPA